MSHEHDQGGMPDRIATKADLDGLTKTLTAAFQSDPLLGSLAFPNARDSRCGCVYLVSALRYPCVQVIGDFAAAAIWIPPGGSELTADDEERIEPLVDRLVGRALPTYSSCSLALRPRTRASLRTTTSACSAPIPTIAAVASGSLCSATAWRASTPKGCRPIWNRPTRSTTAATSMGFRQVSEFTTPDGTRTVTTMWRDPEGPEAVLSSEAAMSEKGSSVIERAYAAWSADGLDAFFAHWAVNAAWRSIPSAADDRGPMHGRHAVHAYLDDWLETFDDFRVELVEVTDVGEDQVVAVLRYGGRAKRSGNGDTQFQ